MIDYLIFYEHKVREYDSVMLLKIALEKKGYSVVIEKTAKLSYLKYLKKKNKPKVIITYSLYNNFSLITQVISVAWNVKKVVNLQWEQIISDDPEVAKKKIPCDCAAKAVHICWGDAIRDRLIKYGVKNAITTGAIHLDFLRNGFESFYDSRDEIENQFALPRGKMILYISTYRVELTKKEIDVLIEKKGERYNKFLEDMSVSRRITLEWLDALLQNNPDSYVVYRPHPSENLDEEIKSRIEKGRFFFIPDKSIKQWIIVADKIYTWMSTAIVETYFANKDCQIIRPVSVMKEYDASIYAKANIICDLEKLLSDYSDGSDSFPIYRNEIIKYYSDTKSYAFQNIVNLLEDVLHSNKYDIKRYGAILYIQAIKVITIRLIKKFIYSCGISSNTFFLRKIPLITKWLDFFYYYQNKEEYEIVTEEESAIIAKKICNIVDRIE